MKSVFPLFVAVALVLLPYISSAGEWVPFESDELYQYAYNENEILRSADKDTLRVWVRFEGRSEKIRQRLIARKETRKDLYKDYQGSKQLMEIDCAKRTMDVLSSVDYKVNGEALWSITFSMREAEPIPQGSRIDTLAGIVCKKQ